jgi:hypothetical protein
MMLGSGKLVSTTGMIWAYYNSYCMQGKVKKHFNSKKAEHCRIRSRNYRYLPANPPVAFSLPDTPLTAH